MGTEFYDLPTWPDPPASGTTINDIWRATVGEGNDSLANKVDAELYRIDRDLTNFYSEIAGDASMEHKATRLDAQTLSPMLEGFQHCRESMFAYSARGNSAGAAEIFFTDEPLSLRLLSSGDPRLVSGVQGGVFRGPDGTVYAVCLKNDAEVEIEGQTYTYPFGMYFNTELPNGRSIRTIMAYYSIGNGLQLKNDVDELKEFRAQNYTQISSLQDRMSALEADAAKPQTVDRYITKTIPITAAMASGAQLMTWTRIGDALPVGGYVRLVSSSEAVQQEKEACPIVPTTIMGSMGIPGTYAAFGGSLIIIPADINLNAQQASAVLGTAMTEGITIPAGTWLLSGWLDEALEALSQGDYTMVEYSEDKSEFITDQDFAPVDYFPLSDTPLLGTQYYCSTSTDKDGLFVAERCTETQSGVSSVHAAGGSFVPVGEMFPEYAMLPNVYMLPCDQAVVAAVVVTQTLDLPAGVMAEDAVTIPAGTYLFGRSWEGGTVCYTRLRRIRRIRDMFN